MRSVIAALTVLLFTASCQSRVYVGEHLGASDFQGSPKRIFVTDQLDTHQNSSLPGEFSAAIATAMGKCGIAVAVYRPNGMDLDGELKLKVAVQQFKPDAVLGIRLVHRQIQGLQIAADTYAVTLYEVAQRREIWRGEISTRPASAISSDRLPVGEVLADHLLRAMAGDNVIKTCPAFPPEK